MSGRESILGAETDVSPAEPPLHKTRRRLPHWCQEGSTYFVTFRLISGSLPEAERWLVLDHIRRGDGVYYRLLAAAIMPDHVHLVLKPESDYTLPRIMKGIKGVSARLINRHRGTQGTVWQDESWDRILRDEAEFLEAMQYIADNPVRAGFCREPGGYEWLYLNPDDPH
jgi:putative transposase